MDLKGTVVIKVGTSSLLQTSDGEKIVSLANISRLIEVIVKLRKQNRNVVLVTSGAVGFGAHRLGIKERPTKVSSLQALAAIGQMRLMRLYDDLFSSLNQPVSQILLTYESLETRTQYLNARNTFMELFAMGVVPIVNENDTVAVQELRFGDNDTLSAMVAGLVNAETLFLLTDVDSLYTSNPREDPDAKPIHVVENINDLVADVEGKGTSFGTGGMKTKIAAAKLACGYGLTTVICNGTVPESILDILKGKVIGTRFLPNAKKNVVTGRRRWILGMPIQGEIIVDEGAAKAILGRKSLFAAGVLDVKGIFGARDGTIKISSLSGKELGKGLSNYSSKELLLIKGKRSEDIYSILGYHGTEWVVSRENYALILVPSPSSATTSVNVEDYDEEDDVPGPASPESH